MYTTKARKIKNTGYEKKKKQELGMHDEDKECTLNNAALSTKPHIPFLLLCVSHSWKNSKLKLTLTLPHILFATFEAFRSVKSALANPFHFKQVQAVNSFRT